MTVYHAATLDLLADELARHRRYQTDAAAVVTRWQAEMPSMGTSIAGMTLRCEELAAVCDDLESLLAIARGANEAEAEFAAAMSGAGR